MCLFYLRTTTNSFFYWKRCGVSSFSICNSIHRRLIYKEHKRTHAEGTDPGEGFRSLRGAPLDTSRCLGGESTPRPYGRLTRRPNATSLNPLSTEPIHVLLLHRTTTNSFCYWKRYGAWSSSTCSARRRASNHQRPRYMWLWPRLRLRTCIPGAGYVVI